MGGHLDSECQEASAHVAHPPHDAQQDEAEEKEPSDCTARRASDLALLCKAEGVSYRSKLRETRREGLLRLGR